MDPPAARLQIGDIRLGAGARVAQLTERARLRSFQQPFLGVGIGARGVRDRGGLLG